MIERIKHSLNGNIVNGSMKTTNTMHCIKMSD